jgi:uncharacterized protein YqeY
MLIEQIKKDQVEARKTKSALAATLLTTVIGEATTVAKNAQRVNPTDEEVTAVIKKFLKGINDTQEALRKGNALDTAERMAVVNAEQEILERYLPQQMTEVQLQIIVNAAILGGTPENMGALMGYLKQNHAGQYDGKMANSVIKGVLDKSAKAS